MQRWLETERGDTLVIRQMGYQEWLEPKDANGKYCRPAAQNIGVEHFNDITGIDDFRGVRLLWDRANGARAEDRRGIRGRALRRAAGDDAGGAHWTGLVSSVPRGFACARYRRPHDGDKTEIRCRKLNHGDP